MTQPDVIIVGGGLAGLSVGWHLPSSLNVLILERAPSVGTEATSQNAGMVRRTGEDPVERALAIRSGQFYADPPADWTAQSLSKQTGAVLALARDPYQLHDAVADLRQSGIRIERVSKLVDIAPVFQHSPIREGWLLPDERVADSHALVQGFVAGLSRQGQEVRCHQTVSGFMVEGGKVIGVMTNDGPISCGKVVLAAGAWSSILAQQSGLHRVLTPLRRSLIQTEAHSTYDPHHPWCWIDDVGIYVRPEAGGWLCSPCDETPDETPAPESRGPISPPIMGLVHEKIKRFFPVLTEHRFSRGWSDFEHCPRSTTTHGAGPRTRRPLVGGRSGRVRRKL